MGGDTFGDESGEPLPVDGQRGTCGHGRLRRAIENERPEAAQFSLQQARRFVGQIGAERITAYQLGQPGGLVRRGRLCWPHLVEAHGHTRFGRLPRRLAPGQPPANNN